MALFMRGVSPENGDEGIVMRIQNWVLAVLVVFLGVQCTDDDVTIVPAGATPPVEQPEFGSEDPRLTPVLERIEALEELESASPESVAAADAELRSKLTDADALALAEFFGQIAGVLDGSVPAGSYARPTGFDGFLEHQATTPFLGRSVLTDRGTPGTMSFGISRQPQMSPTCDLSRCYEQAYSSFVAGPALAVAVERLTGLLGSYGAVLQVIGEASYDCVVKGCTTVRFVEILAQTTANTIVLAEKGVLNALLAGLVVEQAMQDAMDYAASEFEKCVRERFDVCACPAPKSWCSVFPRRQCVDTRTDELHCGDCNAPACGAQEECRYGVCVPLCSGGEKWCDGRCVDVYTSKVHCGDCAPAGETCLGEEKCIGGHCELQCGAGEKTCNGTCTDVLSNNLNCNDCGIRCPEGQNCSAGRCEATCGALGQTCCEGIFCSDALACVSGACEPDTCGTTHSDGAIGQDCPVSLTCCQDPQSGYVCKDSCVCGGIDEPCCNSASRPPCDDALVCEGNVCAPCATAGCDADVCEMSESLSMTCTYFDPIVAYTYSYGLLMGVTAECDSNGGWTVRMGFGNGTLESSLVCNQLPDEYVVTSASGRHSPDRQSGTFDTSFTCSQDRGSGVTLRTTGSSQFSANLLSNEFTFSFDSVRELLDGMIVDVVERATICRNLAP
jgi:hypothetical protein